jgi:hypothetical protein
MRHAFGFGTGADDNDVSPPLQCCLDNFSLWPSRSPQHFRPPKEATSFFENLLGSHPLCSPHLFLPKPRWMQGTQVTFTLLLHLHLGTTISNTENRHRSRFCSEQGLNCAAHLLCICSIKTT